MSEIESKLEDATDYVCRISRRDFLNAAALIAGAAAITTVMPATISFAANLNGMQVMGKYEYAVFKRLMEVMLPIKGTPLVPLDKIPVLQTLDAALLAPMPGHIWDGLKGGIQYFNEGAKADFGKPFVDLSNAEAERFLDSWASSGEAPRRALAMGLKKLVGLAYWANPPTWKPLGYDGPVSRKWALESYGNSPLPQQS